MHLGIIRITYHRTATHFMDWPFREPRRGGHSEFAMTIWLELMVKLRTLLSVFTFILKAKARDYGKGRYISDAASGVRPITMHCVSWPIRADCACRKEGLLIHLAGGELAPRLSLVSPKVFSPFCHRWSFRSLPLSPQACLVGDTSFPTQSSTWLHRYYLNWTKLDNAITKFKMKCIQLIIEY